jgi:hypothetical protein
MRAIPWDDIEKEVQSGNETQVSEHRQILANALIPFILMEPITPINATCTPPALPAADTIDCSRYPTALSGKPRDKPAKVAHMIQLGFDSDVLEIHLHELDDVVDYFVIVESTRTHLQGLFKPLIWEHLSLQPRFARFKQKVIHIVIDDHHITPSPKDIWELENRMERTRWEAFLEWNAKTQVFGDTDLVGFGDTDEIASREAIHLLKHCEMGGASSVDIGIWFPWSYLDTDFITDFPVPNHKFTLGGPTFWTLGSGIASRLPPTKQRGKSGEYLLGGFLMTDPRYVPNLMMKAISCSECGKDFESLASLFTTYLKEPTTASIRDLELKFNRGDDVIHRVKAVADVKGELEGIEYVPWYLQCNSARFPYWWRGGHDTRLDF